MADSSTKAAMTEGEPAAEAEGEASQKQDSPPDSGSILSLADVQENKGAYRVYTSLIQKMNKLLVGISNNASIIGKEQITNEISIPLLQSVRGMRKQLIGFILGGEVKGFEMAKS